MFANEDSNKRPLAIIFDAEGTLFRSSISIEDLILDTIKNFDVIIKREKVKNFFWSAWNSNQALALRYAANKDALLEKNKDCYYQFFYHFFLALGISPDHAHHRSHILFEQMFGLGQKKYSIFYDTYETLEYLSNKGYRLIIVSNWDIHLNIILERLNIRGFFERVFVSKNVGFEKPDPRIFEFALISLKLNSSEVVHVGDNPIDDLLGAKNLGIRALLLDRSSLSMTGGSINTLKDLINIF